MGNTTKASYDANQWYCPPPCKEDIPACNAHVDLFAGGSYSRYTPYPALDSFDLKCDECIQTATGRYKVEDCHQYGLTCSSTLINVVSCDDQTNGFSVYADGDTSYNCCNVKTGACGFKCKAYVN